MNFNSQILESALHNAMPSVGFMISALVLNALGVFLIWSKWRGQHTSGAKLTLGWLIVAFASVPWVIVFGVEFGITFQLICIALMTWLLVASTADIKPLKALPEGAESVTKSRVSHVAFQVLVVVVLCGAFSILAVISVGSQLPISRPAQLVLGSLSFPLIWSGVALVALYTSRVYLLSGLLLLMCAGMAWSLLG
ncbi:hypothetical protein [Echinimonas agarilytica]|uniref:Uncharacterized protein n=1 Tax=Echinimonas agarilytica TaxID=1215918 RepID=A0AA42B9U0_9GAMM|nr:hypothetical protein [Echinimonas agarilytica]MCM2681281.1 hypothetical protein [Echinimonas agarilytica]